DEDFTADVVELYFDLAFVFAFSQLVAFLVGEHTLTAIGKGALLFLLIWLPWSQFTWSANAVSSGSRIVRFLFLVATVATIPMAASVQSAFEDGGPTFAISLSVIVAMALFVIVSGMETGSDIWRGAVRYAVPTGITMAVVIAGSFLEDEARIVAWIVAILIFLYGTIRAGESEWIIRTGHFAERHALIVIVALGEVIVALGVPVVNSFQEGKGLPAETIAALIAAGTFSGLLWWSYFDRPAPALELRAEGVTDARDRGRYARDVYTYSHAPMVAGVILAAAALEEVTLHPTDPLDATFRWMLFAGLAGFLGGVGLAVWRAYRVVAKERIAAMAVIGLVLVAAGSLDGLVLVVLVDLVLVLMLIAEQLRIEGPTGTSETVEVAEDPSA
ncbi:MAG: low temperature requirement protein A, partial [Actinomycetota bacterium]